MDQVIRLLPAAFTMAALCALESLLSASASDAIAGKRHDSSAELMGCGLANMASSLFGGIPTCGAIARTTLNAKSGAQTRLAGVFNALSLLLIMLFMAPIVGQVPTAALAGLLILLAFKMVDIKAYKSLITNHHWTDFAMMAITFGATVFVSLVVGISCGLGIAAIAYFTRARAVKKTIVRLDEEQQTDPKNQVTVASLEGVLFFHTARQVIEQSATYAPDKALVLCLRDTQVIDASGIQALKEVIQTHRESRLVYLSGVSSERKSLLKNTGVFDVLDDACVFDSRDDAVEAARAA